MPSDAIREADRMSEHPDATDPGEPPASKPVSRHLHLSLSRSDRIVSSLFLLLAAGLVPWTVLLGLSLPPKYDAGHWDLLWTGFDVALICVLGYAAWAAWFRRQILASTAIVAGTLLLCDAWFDIVTSFGHRDQWITLLTGFGAEIPLALFFFWLYRQIVMNTLLAVHERLGDGPAPRRLRDAQMLFLATRPPIASNAPGSASGSGDATRPGEVSDD